MWGGNSGRRTSSALGGVQPPEEREQPTTELSRVVIGAPPVERGGESRCHPVGADRPVIDGGFIGMAVSAPLQATAA